MAELTYRYFLCTDSPINAQIDLLNTKRRIAVQAVREFAKKYGIEKVYGTEPKNFSFDVAKPGPAWSKNRLSRYGGQYKPHGKTEEGRALRVLVDALPSVPEAREFGHDVVPGFGATCYNTDDNSLYRDFVPWYSKTHAVVAMLEYEEAANGKPKKRKLVTPSWMREIARWELERIKDTGELPS